MKLNSIERFPVNDTVSHLKNQMAFYTPWQRKNIQ